MTQIFLVRHGEAEGNLYRRAQGHHAAHLTVRGRAQLPYLTKRFEGVHIDAAYASDLDRAFETAEAAVLGKGIPVIPEPRLREMGVGIWEDRPWGDIAYTESAMLNHFFTDPARWIVPGAERHEEVQQRMYTALREIAERHEGQTVLCGSHGTCIRAFMAYILGVPSERITEIPHMDNTAVSLLTWDGERFHIEYSNDHSHLPETVHTLSGANWQKGVRRGSERDLRYTPFDTENGKELYLRCYRDAWQTAHGSLAGFDAAACWNGALFREHEAPGSLTAAWLGEEFAGILALDEKRGARSGIGWIGFCYIVPERRGKGGGAQLIGCAVSRYRALGRRVLRLTVAPENPALGFYEALGFARVGTERGAREDLYVMEMAL